MSDLIPTKTLKRTQLFGSNDGAEFNDCNTLSNNYGMDVLDSRNPIQGIYVYTDADLHMVRGLQTAYRGDKGWSLRDGDVQPSYDDYIGFGTYEYISKIELKVGPNSYYGVKTVTELRFTIHNQLTSTDRVSKTFGTVDTHVQYESFTVEQKIFAFGGYQAPWEHTQNSKIIGLYFMVQDEPPKPYDTNLDARAATFDTTQPNVEQKITLKPPRKADMLPNIVYGLYHLDVDGSHNIRARSSTEVIDKDSFNAAINSWGDTRLNAGGINCIDIPLGGEIQGGVVPYQMTNNQQRVTMSVDFDRPFTVAPKVILWLTGLDMDKSRNWRINIYGWNISETGFNVSVGTWDDSVLHGIGVSWLAVPADAKDVVVGTFTATSKSQTGQVDFGRKLPGTPVVICALSEMDFGSGHDLIFKATIDSTSSEGFKYNVKTEEGGRKSLMFPTRFSYIAIVKHDQ